MGVELELMQIKQTAKESEGLIEEQFINEKNDLLQTYNDNIYEEDEKEKKLWEEAIIKNRMEYDKKNKQKRKPGKKNPKKP